MKIFAGAIKQTKQNKQNKPVRLNEHGLMHMIRGRSILSHLCAISCTFAPLAGTDSLRTLACELEKQKKKKGNYRRQTVRFADKLLFCCIPNAKYLKNNPSSISFIL